MDDFLANWITQLRKGILEYCVLRVLEDVSLYGYDIVRQLRTMEVLVISEGTIYPILSRLRKEGLLNTYLEESPEGPARKYYRLTDRGRDILNQMRNVWATMTQSIETALGTKGKQR